MKRGVQGPKICFADPGQLGHHGHIDVIGDVHRLEIGVVFNQRQLGAKRLGLGHDVLHGLQLGHIQPGFGRHVQVGVAGAQPRLLVLGNGPAHAAFAPVVGGQGQVPVAKHAMEFLQVVESGAGGCEHIAAVVAKGVLLEVEIIAGGRHELPHTGGLGAGHGLRVERALDVGQQCQLGRHATAFQLFNDVEQVFAGPLGHALHVVGAAGVPLLAVLHQFVLQVGHGKAAANAFPQVGGGGQRGHLAAAGPAGSDRAQRPGGDEGGVAAGGGVRGGWARVALAVGGGARGGAAGQPQQSCKAGEAQNFHQKLFFHWRRAANTATASCGWTWASKPWAAAATAASRTRRKGLMSRSSAMFDGSVGCCWARRFSQWLL